MAKSARNIVFEGMEILPEALTPFVEKRLESSLKGHWQAEVADRVRLKPSRDGSIAWDQAGLLNAMNRYWGEAFGTVLGRAERAIVNELVEVRNRLAHNRAFSYDDAERALDSMRRLTEAIGAGDAAGKLGRMRETILRTKFAELRRNEERRGSRGQQISVETAGGLRPWREVVEPHRDVATGDFRQAEFAADLGKVHTGNAPSEYLDPQEFFSRTYLTDGLSTLLVTAAKRLVDTGGDPIVELQTNFGGGKTHSMLALYHMTGNVPTQDLPGLDQLLSEHGISLPQGINRAVMVGTSRGPQDTIPCEKGLEIRTTWGEMAWQLGGASAYQAIAENDANGIAPGSHLLESIFRDCAPCIILIDEWVAYLRQIYRTDGLPSGSFDANLSFVQSLTEAVKASPGTVLVAALPASQIEVGGAGGEEALARLKQTFSRVESSWRPASQEESYEIVRRRLFKEIPGDKHIHRDNTLKQFASLYRDNPDEFPRGSADEDYRRKLEKAYPIHPELFDQLYTSWGSLERFQRTRGVLRLMAQAVHELWMNNDPSLMIMPGSIAISSDRVEPELLHYLDPSWQSIIAGDVDGGSSIPYKIDQSTPNLNRHSATRRIARAIFMGTSPVHQQENKGLDDKQINLGVIQPGERPAIFGDALRRLSNQARFLHTDLGRYWYSISASLNRLAADRAEQYEEALVLDEIDKALASYINGQRDRGHFDAVQVTPGNSGDVPDESSGVRVVILGVTDPHSAGDVSKAKDTAEEILLNRGQTPRINRNMLVFLAADARRIGILKDGMRDSLAWESIVKDTGRLNLTQSDSALAKEKLGAAKDTLDERIKEAWCFLIYPGQDSPGSDLQWVTGKVPVQDGVLGRASKRLVDEEALLPELGPNRLDRELQKYIWKDNHHLLLKDLWEYSSRYIYLPRLKNRQVLVETVKSAISELMPGPFAFAESWDDTDGNYRGLSIDRAISVQVVIDSESLIVAPHVAKKNRPEPSQEPSGGKAAQEDVEPAPPEPTEPTKDNKPTRFFGTVMISPERPARDIHQVVEGIVEQLTSISNSDVNIKLEITAEVPDGLDSSKVRTLVENANTLGFIDKEIK